ncbi:MAG: glutamate-1-semialdehyde 2,1-aminomutase [Thermodesulfobacteriota bacterium]|nr:glutamate-1-semialdehyde 2,1-aminomutase [Thermodesulfobacteriota bacterium]
MNTKRSEELFKEANRYIPGGVNSPVRAYKAVGGNPLFIERAKGSKIYDADGNEYLDYLESWGPMILGHSNPKVISALKRVIEKGTSFGAPTSLEIELASMIVEAVPSIDSVRMVSSGTEATMSSIRLARGYTKRDNIIKFEGCYHGHVDSLLVRAGSGATTFGIPDSPGIPFELAKKTITLPFNNIQSVKKAFKEDGKNIAAIIVEPIPGNMGVILPKVGFLECLRDICYQYDALLIFDEVITGFRVSFGGAQKLLGISPDLTCLGKIIGGGLPVGAFGGKREIMQMISPVGPIYQAGTLSGNPLAITAGIETLKLLSQKGVYETLEEKSRILTEGINEAANKTSIPVFSNRVGSMFSLFFTDTLPVDYSTVKMCDTERFASYFWAMLEQGIYLAPSQFEASFISLAHTDNDIEKTIKASAECFLSISP